MDNLTETKLTSEKIYSGCILDFYRDTVRLPNGGTAPRELSRHVGAVCIVPLLDDGRVIVERFRRLDPLHTPGVLGKNHGPFAWGRDAHEAVYHATVLEEVAKMAFVTKLLDPTAGISPSLVEKHFRRKHGPDAYYGQH